MTTTDDRQQHRHRRHRRLAFTTVGAVGARLVSLVTVLITVPLTANYLGVERYGLWGTIASLLALLNFADLGIGNGLLNVISECHGRSDIDGARQYAASAFFMLTAIAFTVAGLFFAAYPWIPWPEIFKVSNPMAVREAGPATAAILVCLVANIPLSVVQRVQQGFQEGFIDSAWSAAGKIMGLAGVLFVIWFKGGLPWLVLALAGIPVVITCLNGINLFWFRKPELRPRWNDVHWTHAQRVFTISFLFLIVQIAGTFAFSADSLVLARLMGPAAVAEYVIVFQMFSLGPMLLNMFLSALWPAYGEAIARGDWEWIRTAFWRSVSIGLAINVPYATFLIVFGKTALHLWVGDKITTSSSLLVAFAIWIIMNSIINPIAILLNGANAMRFNAISGSLMACVNLLLSIVLTGAIGISGVIWGSILAQLFVTLIPSTVYIFRYLQGFVPSPIPNPQPQTRTVT